MTFKNLTLAMKKKIAQSDKKLHKNKCREWERETKTLQTASKTEAWEKQKLILRVGIPRRNYY